MSLEDIRSKILQSILKREAILRHIFVFAMSLMSFLVINNTYGYMGVLKNEWLAVAMSFLCAFIPVGFIGIILFVFISIHLSALSLGVCIVFMIIWIVFFIFSAMCGAKGYLYLTLVPVLFTVHLPFLPAVYEGFFGKRRSSIPLLGSAVLAYFLRTIKLSETVIKTNDDELSAFVMLRDNMLANLNFYLFIIAMAALFLVIAFVKYLPIKGAWAVAGIMGVIVEFLTMLIGYAITGSQALIELLVISNVITLCFVLIITFLFGEVKVNRRRVLSFEDDDYDYYVICTPKVQIEKTNKRVLRITRSKKELKDDNGQED